MNVEAYVREFHLTLDGECQALMDSCYKLITKLDYYQNDCGFQFPVHVQKFKTIIFNMIKNYEERHHEL